MATESPKNMEKVISAVWSEEVVKSLYGNSPFLDLFPPTPRKRVRFRRLREAKYRLSRAWDALRGREDDDWY